MVIPYRPPREMPNHHSDYREYYEDFSYGRDHNEWAFEHYEPQLGGTVETRRLLDCGVGRGQFLAALSKRGYRELYGFDIGDFRKDGVPAVTHEFRVLDASVDILPWPDNFFDVATAWCLLAHLENPHHFIRELVRVLKPGGYFFNVMPHLGSLRIRKNFLFTGDLERYTSANDHIAIFTPALFEKTLLRYFTLLAVEYYVDHRIYANRLGRFKRWGIETRWPLQRKFREWFGANTLQVLQKSA